MNRFLLQVVLLSLHWIALHGFSHTTTSSSSNDVGAWLPVASVSGLQGIDAPVSVTIANRNFVVWNKNANDHSSDSKDQNWSVMVDVCPHKLAPLSQGRVDATSGCIECPYHGWQFDVNGKLTRLPQLDTNVSAIDDGKKENRNAKSLPVHVVGDMIFAFFESSMHGEMWSKDRLPEDICPALIEQAELGKTWFSRELPYSVDFLIENFMDPAHIPFAHHGLQGVREDATPIASEEVAMNFTHVEVSFKDVIRNKARDGIVSFQRPFYYHFRTRKDDGNFRTNLNILIAPIQAGRSRVFLSSIAPNWVPRWLAHAGSNRFLNTDVWLHDAELVARSDPSGQLNYVYASSSDKGPAVFRKWWTKHGFAASPEHTFGPSSINQLTKLSRREQIDPWEGHTKHCSKCRTALERFKKAKTGSIYIAIASIIFLRKWRVASFALSGLSIYLGNLCEKICTFIEGNPYRSGIKDRSVSHENSTKQNKK